MKGGDLLEVVAIDGPSGSGKSTIAGRLAERLGWRHLDTGAMYRAVTLRFLERNVPLEDPEAVRAALADLDLRLGEEAEVHLDGREVGAELRKPEVEARVSAVSALPAVRRAMVVLQRAEASKGPLVAEGRDMTTVVFPDARWRVYLEASVEERARRRLRDFEAASREVSLDEVLEEIRARDFLDSTRADAPLRKAEGVFVLDTTGLGIEDCVERIAALVRGEAGS